MHTQNHKFKDGHSAVLFSSPHSLIRHPLIPLSRTSFAPTGVIGATGVIAPNHPLSPHPSISSIQTIASIPIPTAPNPFLPLQALQPLILISALLPLLPLQPLIILSPLLPLQALWWHYSLSPPFSSFFVFLCLYYQDLFHFFLIFGIIMGISEDEDREFFYCLEAGNPSENYIDDFISYRLQAEEKNDFVLKVAAEIFDYKYIAAYHNCIVGNLKSNSTFAVKAIREKLMSAFNRKISFYNLKRAANALSSVLYKINNLLALHIPFPLIPDNLIDIEPDNLKNLQQAYQSEVRFILHYNRNGSNNKTTPKPPRRKEYHNPPLRSLISLKALLIQNKFPNKKNEKKHYNNKNEICIFATDLQK